jgi:hypothetical protein
LITLARTLTTLTTVNFIMKKVKFTLFTSKKNLLTKQIDLKNGEIIKIAAAQMTQGTAKICEMEFHEFPNFLNSCSPFQSISFGIFKSDKETVQVKTSGNLVEGSIARSLKFFEYCTCPGIVMLDHDPEPEHYTEPEQLISILSTIIPNFASAAKFVRSSSSSRIVLDNNRVKAQGFHIYFPVKNAADIPRFGKALFEHLCSKGYSFSKMSKSGAKLTRTLIDGVVFSPERLDFVAAPVPLNPRITICKPDESFFDGDFVDTTLLQDVSAKHDSVFDLQKVFITLPQDTTLFFANGDEILLCDLLKEPTKYNGLSLADPLNGPEKGKTTAKFWFNDGLPMIHSFANGVSNIYHLQLNQKPTINVVAGQLYQQIKQMEAIIIKDGKLYQREMIVKYHNGELFPINENWFSYYIGNLIEWRKYSSNAKRVVTIDPPPKIASTYLALRGEWELPILKGIVNCPVFTTDGTLFSTSGYNSTTQLLLDTPTIKLNNNVNKNDAENALVFLSTKLSSFSFDNNAALSTYLALLISIVIRPTIKSAPLFVIDAPVMGSGKSLLADIASIIATGEKASVINYSGDFVEDEKRLSGILMQSRPFNVFDEVKHEIYSPLLCSTLTQAKVSCRLLGSSTMLTLSTNMLFVATGNNVRISGDLIRRTVFCRLNPKMESPYNKKFNGSIIDEVKQDRTHYLEAIVTIIAAFFKEKPQLELTTLGGFEEWTNIVRASLVWLGYSDPIVTMRDLATDDTGKLALSVVLENWNHYFKAPVTTSQIIDLAGGELRAVLFEIASKRNSNTELDSVKLGKWLSSKVDVVINNLTIVKHVERARLIKWSIKEVHNDSTIR